MFERAPLRDNLIGPRRSLRDGYDCWFKSSIPFYHLYNNQNWCQVRKTFDWQLLWGQFEWDTFSINSVQVWIAKESKQNQRRQNQVINVLGCSRARRCGLSSRHRGWLLLKPAKIFTKISLEHFRGKYSQYSQYSEQPPQRLIIVATCKDFMENAFVWNISDGSDDYSGCRKYLATFETLKDYEWFSDEILSHLLDLGGGGGPGQGQPGPPPRCLPNALPCRQPLCQGNNFGLILYFSIFWKHIL